MSQAVYYTPSELGVTAGTTVSDFLEMMAKNSDIYVRWIYGQDTYIVTHRIAGDPMRYDDCLYEGLRVGPIKPFGGIKNAVSIWGPYSELLRNVTTTIIWRDNR